jgi:hypothetical protein
MRPATSAAITVTEAPLAAASTGDLSETEAFTGDAAYATAAAAQHIAGATEVQLVEAYELV